MDDQKIIEKGADYVAEKYPWEAAGYFWDLHDINSIIKKGNANSQDSMTTFKQVSNCVNAGPGNTYKKSPPSEWKERKTKFFIVRKIIK